jgi:site-specific recombinase XerD
MLRHACGFKLANDGHDTRAIQAYLGHRSIMSTVRYMSMPSINGRDEFTFHTQLRADGRPDQISVA